MKAIWILLAVMVLALVPSCTVAGKLPPCMRNSARMWCRCEVAQTTEERAVAGLPAACTIPFVAAACVDPDPRGGFLEMLRGIHQLNAHYTAPSGWPPYVMIGDNAYWLRCPAKTDGSASDCVGNNQPTSPWPGLPIVDLNAATLSTPGLGPQGYGGAGDGGSSAIGDCALCLADAPCDGLTADQCVAMHCAAVCPVDNAPAATCVEPGANLTPACAGPGSACGGGAACCSGLSCYAGDIAAVCM